MNDLGTVPVQAVGIFSGRQALRSASNYSFVDAVARKNVELTLANTRKDSPVLTELASNGTIKMTGAIYNLETGDVGFFV